MSAEELKALRALAETVQEVMNGLAEAGSIKIPAKGVEPSLVRGSSKAFMPKDTVWPLNTDDYQSLRGLLGAWEREEDVIERERGNEPVSRESLRALRKVIMDLPDGLAEALPTTTTPLLLREAAAQERRASLGTFVETLRENLIALEHAETLRDEVQHFSPNRPRFEKRVDASRHTLVTTVRTYFGPGLHKVPAPTATVTVRRDLLVALTAAVDDLPASGSQNASLEVLVMEAFVRRSIP